MHIQQVSTESSSSIAEHDLTDLVASLSVTGGAAGESDYFNPRPPPKAIIYASADSSAGHTNASTPQHHPVSFIPTVSPPRYQLSLLSHPGSPPSRADTRFTSSSNGTSSTSTNARHTRLRESYPRPEARRAPSSPPPSSSHRTLSNGSAPTVLYGINKNNHNDESVHGFDATWHSSRVDAISSSAGTLDQRRIPPPLRRHMTSLPEYNEVYARRGEGQPYEPDEEYMLHDSTGLEPMTDEQHARITQGQYRLGVGYDDEHTGVAIDGRTGTAGGNKKRISEERRLERLRALEREFGRVKNDNGRTVSRTAEGAFKESQEGRKPSAATLLSYSSNMAKDGQYARAANPYDEDHDGNDDDDDSEISEKMTFKQMRIKEKQERARINKELGITKNGNLRTQGRKMRLSMRWCQGLLGLVAVTSGLGGAFFTNPAKDDNLPPQGAISTWFLYIISLASFLCTFYLFTIQPFVVRRKTKHLEKNGHQHPLVGGGGGGQQDVMNNLMPNGIVLPIFSSPSAHAYLAGKKMKAGGRGAFGKKMGKKGYMQPYHQSQPMMVNLVVDPNMLAGSGLTTSKPPSRYDDSGFDDEEDATKTRKTSNTMGNHQEVEEYDEDEDHDFHIPNSTAKAEEAAKLRANQPLARMMDTMTIMRLQDKWREARRRMRKLAIIDACWALVWFAESLFALGYGGSCKPGSGNGWCDTYNMALASGVLLCVAFSTSFVFDVLDLRRSRSTPRVSRTV